MNSLDEQILRKASEEGLLMERKERAGTVAQLTKFMDKYGYKTLVVGGLRTKARNQS